jgi:hypothetical protein
MNCLKIGNGLHLVAVILDYRLKIVIGTVLTTSSKEQFATTMEKFHQELKVGIFFYFAGVQKL